MLNYGKSYVSIPSEFICMNFIPDLESHLFVADGWQSMTSTSIFFALELPNNLLRHCIKESSLGTGLIIIVYCHNNNDVDSHGVVDLSSFLVSFRKSVKFLNYFETMNVAFDFDMEWLWRILFSIIIPFLCTVLEQKHTGNGIVTWIW